MSSFGRLGIEVLVRCQTYGFVTITGGISIIQRHENCRDCDACVRMQNMFGTCEYIGETLRCTCDEKRARERLGTRRKSVQTVLDSESTAYVRYRYWLGYLDEQRKQIERESSN